MPSPRGAWERKLEVAFLAFGAISFATPACARCELAAFMRAPVFAAIFFEAGARVLAVFAMPDLTDVLAWVGFGIEIAPNCLFGDFAPLLMRSPPLAKPPSKPKGAAGKK